MTRFIHDEFAKDYLEGLLKPYGKVAIILSELEDEKRWDEAFAKSQNVLAKLASEAMAEYRAGKTQELDPETL